MTLPPPDSYFAALLLGTAGAIGIAAVYAAAAIIRRCRRSPAVKTRTEGKHED